ncbi:MAG: lipase maturation factor family protein [Myxococcota bacterium]|nr:lipase maturation factor family protein [Myxococcota bacterium]
MPRWVPRSNPDGGALEGSGPAVVRIFHALLALHFLVAWTSLGVQVVPLIGPEGLEPAVDHFARLATRTDVGILDVPSPFRFGATEPLLLAGCVAGGLLSIAAAGGLIPRVLLPLSALLYLGYANAAPTFLSFQWDNLLVEAGFLAALLPRDRPFPLGHLAMRLLLFKVFFQSGLAKWTSPRGDWHDGSAMALYYQTAPLPTPLASVFHHLPQWWHALESWWALAFELAVPATMFGGRRLRTLAFSVFGTFLIVDFATANYGFFVPLTGALLVFLLEERHAMAALRVLRRPQPAFRAPATGKLMALTVMAWFALSALNGLARFAEVDAAPALRRAAAAWRIANVYHLFGSVTTERIEPEFQTSDDGRSWTAHPLRYKPGPLERPPPLVAPHQPRLDFQLWFYALRWEQSTPRYVVRLVEGLCHAPSRVQPFFPGALPPAPRAVRIVFHDTRFTDGETRRTTGRWWDRMEVGATRTLYCEALSPSDRSATDPR